MHEQMTIRLSKILISDAHFIKHKMSKDRTELNSIQDTPFKTICQIYQWWFIPEMLKKNCEHALFWFLYHVYDDLKKKREDKYMYVVDAAVPFYSL